MVRKQKCWRTLAMASLSLAVFVGCGDDNDGAQFTTAVGHHWRLDELSAEDEQQLCQDRVDFLYSLISKSEFVEFDCTYWSLYDAEPGESWTPAHSDKELQQTCVERRIECMERVEQDGVTHTCRIPEEHCEATVEEYRACYDVLLRDFKRDIEEFPACEELTIEQINSQDASVTFEELPTPCHRVENKCPGIF